MLTSWSRTFSTVCRSVRIDAFFVRTKSFRCGSRTRSFLAAGIPRRFSFSGKFGSHVRGVPPQPLQAVVSPAVLREDVKDEVSEVEQDPPAGRRPFDQQRLDAFVLSQFLQDAIRNRLRLPLGIRGAEHEVVRDRRQLADGENVEMERFLVEGCGDGCTNAVLDGIVQILSSLYKP